MPCSDSRAWERQQDSEVLNILTRLACDYCKEFEARGEKVPKWAAKWWEEHKAEDKERRQDK